MGTNVPTILLFLKRRDDEERKKIEEYVKEVIENPPTKEKNIAGIPNPISAYLRLITEGKVSYDSYCKWISDPSNEDDSKENNFIHQNYLMCLNRHKKSDSEKVKRKICEEIKSEEEEKIFHFILACNQKVLLIKIKDKQEQVLGYKISKKGIVSLDNPKKEVSITEMEKRTSLYSNNPDDDSKINTYIRKAFEGNNDIDITRLNINIPNIDIRLEELKGLIFFNKNIKPKVNKIKKFGVKIFTTPREFLQEGQGQIRLGDAVDLFKKGKKKDFQCEKDDVEISNFIRKNKTKTENKQKIRYHEEERGEPLLKDNLIIRSKNKEIYPPQKIFRLLNDDKFKEYITKNTIGDRCYGDEDWILDYPIKIKKP